MQGKSEITAFAMAREIRDKFDRSIVVGYMEELGHPPKKRTVARELRIIAGGLLALDGIDLDAIEHNRKAEERRRVMRAHSRKNRRKKKAKPVPVVDKASDGETLRRQISIALPAIVWLDQWDRLAAEYGLPFTMAEMIDMIYDSRGPYGGLHGGRRFFTRENVLNWVQNEGWNKQPRKSAKG